MKLLLIITAILTVSCSPIYYQVYSVKCTNCNDLTLENPNFNGGWDSVRVEYFFWRENGVMMFAIYNTKTRPIYIDWKRSGFFRNGSQYEYWSDVQIIKTESLTSTQQVASAMLTNKPTWVNSTGSTTIVKKNERVTFIVSNSVFNKQPVVYSLMPNQNLLPTDSATIQKNVLVGSDSVNSYVRYYSTTNSIHTFRNFITWTLTENSPEGFVIDNSFYIGKIDEIPETLFLTHPYGHSTRFYKILNGEGLPVRDRFRGIYPYEYK